MDEAQQRLEQFVTTLRGYDDPHVAAVADALADSSPLALETPSLATEEWLAVLEAIAGELYLIQIIIHSLPQDPTF